MMTVMENFLIFCILLISVFVWVILWYIHIDVYLNLMIAFCNVLQFRCVF